MTTKKSPLQTTKQVNRASNEARATSRRPVGEKPRPMSNRTKGTTGGKNRPI